MRYLVVFEATDTGYSAYAPDLPGCVSAGDTFEETEQLIRSAIALHLEALREDGLPIPESSTRAEFVEVGVAG